MDLKCRDRCNTTYQYPQGRGGGEGKLGNIPHCIILLMYHHQDHDQFVPLIYHVYITLGSLHMFHLLYLLFNRLNYNVQIYCCR